MAMNSILNIKKLIDDSGVALGMHVADFGCGQNGHVAFPISSAVGADGLVYAVDILPYALEALDNNCAHRSVHNINTVWGDYEREFGVNIPEQSLDRIFFVNNLWSINEFATTLQEMKRLLKPGGQVMIVDWHPRAQDPVAPRLDYRTEVMDIMRQLAYDGWTDLNDFGASENHWGIIASV